LSTAVIDHNSARPTRSKASRAAAAAASVAYPRCQACLASRHPISTPPAPGTSCGIGDSPVKPMNSPVSFRSSAHRPYPSATKFASVRSISASLACRLKVSGK